MTIKWYKNLKRDASGIENKSGVYIFSTKQESDDRFAVDYVGKSENLKDRISYHLSDSEENSKLRNHLKKGYVTKISYAYVDKKYIGGLELYLYNRFEPPCNEIAPPADAEIECNIPDVRKR